MGGIAEDDRTKYAIVNDCFRGGIFATHDSTHLH